MMALQNRSEWAVGCACFSQSWAPPQLPSSWGGTGEPTPCSRRASRATWRGNASRSCAIRRRPGRSLRISSRRWEQLTERPGSTFEHQDHMLEFEMWNSYTFSPSKPLYMRNAQTICFFFRNISTLNMLVSFMYFSRRPTFYFPLSCSDEELSPLCSVSGLPPCRHR